MTVNERMSSDELIALIRANMDIQRRNHPDTDVATEARRVNRELFVEAAKRGLDSNLVQ